MGTGFWGSTGRSCKNTQIYIVRKTDLLRILKSNLVSATTFLGSHRKQMY